MRDSSKLKKMVDFPAEENLEGKFIKQEEIMLKSDDRRVDIFL